MKNLYLIPTDEPSRLWMTKLGNLARCNDIQPIKEELGHNVNIYITSEEEIKEGDYFLYDGTEIRYKNNGTEYHGRDLCHISGNRRYPISKSKKIILTIDQLLDSVQAIDDEFLEWFVKNPSCESVEVEVNLNSFRECHMKGDDCSCYDTADQSFCELYYSNYKIIIPQEEPKQETLEEAAEKYADFSNAYVPIACGSKFHEPTKRNFIEGGNWQAERMYSKEEVIEIAKQYAKRCQAPIQSIEWLNEQLKKK